MTNAAETRARATVDQPSRRGLLGSAGVVALGVLSACSGDDSSQSRGHGARGGPGPTRATETRDVSDVHLVEAALRDEAVLAVTFARARRMPALRDELGLAREHAVTHVRSLRKVLVEPPAAAPASPVDLPRARRRTASAVVRLLENAAEARSHDCRRAESGAVAQLMASIAASHAETSQRWGDL